MTEVDFMRALMLALGQRADLRIWRQNSGTIVFREPGRGTRAFHAGPPKGAADLSGIVIPEGWRLEIECKAGTARTPEQVRWGEFIARSGGVYVLVEAAAGMTLETNVGTAVELVNAAVQARRAA